MNDTSVPDAFNTTCSQVFDPPNLLEAQASNLCQEMFPCHICNKLFQSNDELCVHYTTHASKKFSCDVCNASFKFKSELTKHKNSKHKFKRFRCNKCDRKYGEKIDLEKHFLQVHATKPFYCPICNIAYTMAARLSKHNEIEHPPLSDETNNNWKRYICTDCPLTFVHKNTFVLHYASSHRHKEPVGCEECSASFLTQLELEEHYVRHVEEQYILLCTAALHGCSLCLKFFPSISDLEEHKLLHGELESVEPLACSIEVIDKMVSDVAQKEIDFILNSNNISDDRSRKGSMKNSSSTNTDVSASFEYYAKPELISHKNNLGVFVLQENNSEDNVLRKNSFEGNLLLEKYSEESILHEIQAENIGLPEDEVEQMGLEKNQGAISVQEHEGEKSVVLQENEGEAFYLLTEDADGTYKSSVIDSGCIIVIHNNE